MHVHWCMKIHVNVMYVCECVRTLTLGRTDSDRQTFLLVEDLDVLPVHDLTHD